MIGAASRRRAAAAVVLAWCAALTALAADVPPAALAEHPEIVHPDIYDTGIADLECDPGSSPPSHSSGAACYTHTHSVHRRLDTYREEEDGPLGWAPTGETSIRSCERDVEDGETLDHGMGESEVCKPPDPPTDPELRWAFVETTYTGSGHDVVWHQGSYQDNEPPVFQPATILASELECCGGWTRVATLRALDADVVQVSGVWQDDLRFASRTSDSVLGVSRLVNARFLPGGGGVEVDVELSGVAPGTVYITVDVRDLRATATDSITIGPFTITADPNQAPTVSISGATVTEGGQAELTLTSSVGGGTGTVRFATSDGTATAGSDYRDSSGVYTISGIGTIPVPIPTIDD